MSEHTPGPWEIWDGDRIVCAGKPPKIIGEAARRTTKKEAQANALLMAAAPDLLELAKEVSKLDTGRPEKGCECVSCRAKALVAKAEGKRP